MTGTLSPVADGSEAALRIIHRDPGLLLGVFGPVFLSVWRTKPTPPLFELQRVNLAAAVQQNPGRQLFMCVVAASADAPEQAERDASARMISGHGNKLAGCACVIEGNGFRAAITRTVLTGIVLLIRTPSPIGFFENVSSATVWMQKCIGSRNLSGLPAQVEHQRAAPSHGR